MYVAISRLGITAVLFSKQELTIRKHPPDGSFINVIFKIFFAIVTRKLDYYIILGSNLIKMIKAQ